MKIAKKLTIILILISLIASMIPLTASANSTIAWGAANIDANSVRIRSGPGLDYSVLTHVNSGDIVVILERTNSEWHKVNFFGTVGYISVPLLRSRREIANFNKHGSINGSVVNMRARPNTTSSVLSTYRAGTEMVITGINEGWYKVQHGSRTGYIRSDLMTILSRNAPSSSARRTVAAAPAANLPIGRQIADFGITLVGTNYKWGGNSPATGFDCSGFVTYVMRQHSIRVTRSSSGQYNDNGVHIDKTDLVPGDLVFFSSNGHTVTHVGIYIGDGKFVHASNPRAGVTISDLNSNYYTRVWWGAKRVVE
jgi:cell wall-associated NlpC family hydrolase